MKRFRFSLRTLAILIALLCFVLGSWKLTATLGIKDVRGGRGPGWAINAIAPFVVVADYGGEDGRGNEIQIFRSYYVWFFGWTYRVHGATALPQMSPRQGLAPKGYYSNPKNFYSDSEQ